MDFTFTEDQLLFRDSVKDFLTNEVTPENIRAGWETPTGRSDELWAKLAELGLTGMLVPEAYGGLEMNEEDFILLAEECGRVALSEPLVETALVAVPLLCGATDETIKANWLPKVVTGEAKLAVGHGINPLVADAHIADLLLLQHGDEVHAVVAENITLTAQESVDPSRQIFKVEWTPSAETCIAQGEVGQKLWSDTLNRGALAAAAQQLGLAQAMVSQAVAYTSERHQFGKPIGSFQAVKHQLSNVAVKYEFSKAVVYRAAHAIANDLSSASMNVSHAKIAATEAALLGAKSGMQVHGAMGYTWEVNLHIWMKRAWVLDNAWGDRGFHKKRVADFIFEDNAALGAGNTFIA